MFAAAFRTNEKRVPSMAAADLASLQDRPVRGTIGSLALSASDLVDVVQR
jgi:hypothetical protein